MKVNGETRTLSAPISVQAFLLGEGHTPERVAVERNGEIVPRSRFAETLLQEADTIEVVAFVGGG